jgi:hypothetical protein
LRLDAVAAGMLVWNFNYFIEREISLVQRSLEIKRNRIP